MSVRQPKYSMEEHVRRGKEWYERIRPQVEAGNLGMIVSIDIDTGEYELAADPITASERLLARLPDAQPWVVRIGYPAVDAWGTRLLPNQP
jgi:hypothetical protein